MIGNHQPVSVHNLSRSLNVMVGTRQKKLLPSQENDVPAACADISELDALTGFLLRTTSLRKSVERTGSLCLSMRNPKNSQEIRGHIVENIDQSFLVLRSDSFRARGLLSCKHCL